MIIHIEEREGAMIGKHSSYEFCFEKWICHVCWTCTHAMGLQWVTGK
jgi:hypothetical protein